MVHNSTIFPALKMSSSGIGMVGMLGRLMLTLPSEPASLDPDLPISPGAGELHLGQGNRTLFSYPIFFSGWDFVETYHFFT